MDFKVAGTASGITGIQMDIKVQGITSEIMREALEQARQGRLFILGKMAETISQPRAEMSPFAPRVVRLQINPQQIGAVIGPGGKIIRGIQEATGAKIDIEDDGSVFISAIDEESARRAVNEVEKLTRIPEVGDIFMGRVKTIIPSGAFVEILPGKDGFVHISELEPHRVESVEDAVQIGQEVNVVITAIRPDGKINLSRKALLTGQMPEPGAAAAGGSRPSSGGGRPHGGDRRNNDRGPRGSERRGGPDSRGSFREPRPERPASEGDHLVRRPRDSRMPPRRDSD
jgi:polyribonucleotide nucleotidyltransferase